MSIQRVKVLFAPGVLLSFQAQGGGKVEDSKIVHECSGVKIENGLLYLRYPEGEMIYNMRYITNVWIEDLKE